MPKDNTSVQQLSLINSDFLILPFRRNDRRQHAAYTRALDHGFSIKHQTSEIKHSNS